MSGHREADQWIPINLFLISSAKYSWVHWKTNAEKTVTSNTFMHIAHEYSKLQQFET